MLHWHQDRQHDARCLQPSLVRFGHPRNNTVTLPDHAPGGNVPSNSAPHSRQEPMDRASGRAGNLGGVCPRTAGRLRSQHPHDFSGCGDHLRPPRRRILSNRSTHSSLCADSWSSCTSRSGWPKACSLPSVWWYPVVYWLLGLLIFWRTVTRDQSVWWSRWRW